MSENPASPNPPIPDPAEIARLFPAYHVEGLIGASRSGAVYKARQISLDRDVAIKVLPREFASDAGYHARFSASVMAMARLNHPNLISIYDFGETDGLLFVIMEFVPGQSLFHSAAGKAISSKEAARIVAGVCEGLAHAHEHGIVHRNLNPGNILLTQKAEPKIGDFYIARHHGGDQPESSPYTAPELLSDPEHADARADIFAAGIILHELLTGQLPGTDARPPSAIAGCDPRFDIITTRAAHPSPEMRHPTAAALGRDLREILDTLPSGPKIRTLATGPDPTHPIPPPRPTAVLKSSSSSSAVPWVIATIVLLVGILAFLIFSGNSTPPPPAKPPQPTTSTHSKRPIPSPHEKPKPKPKIHPAPEPSVVPPPEPVEPKPAPEIVEEWPAPAPETPPTELPVEPAPKPESTFDTVSWLDMASTKMREKAKPSINDYQKNLERNFNDFRRGVNRVLRQIDNRDRRNIEPKADKLIDELRENGSNRVPEEFDFGLDAVKERGQSKEEKRLNATLLKKSKQLMAETLAEALAKQKEIDRDFTAEMLALSRTYILGIELQVQRLKDADDPRAAETLQAEADATRQSPERFTRLMQGLDPDPPPAEEEK